MRPPFIKCVALAGVALVALATTASAQRGGGGGRRGGGGGGDRPKTDSAFAEVPRPVPGVASLVLDHPLEFALADSQRAILQTIRHAQDSANRPWIEKLDALRASSTGRPANGPDDLSQEQRDEIAARRAAIADAAEGMRETNAEARQRVMALLTPDQQKKAAKLEEDERKKIKADGDRANSGSQGGGGGRRGGGGGGGGGMGGMGGGMGGGPPED